MPDPAPSLPSKVTPYIALYFLLYILAPILLIKIGHVHLGPIFLFYLACLFIIFSLTRKYAYKKYQLDYKSGELQEKINILIDQLALGKKNTSALETKISRYNSLKEIIEEINRDLDLDSVAASLTSIASSAISGNNSVCLLYLIDTKRQKLTLIKTKKDAEGLIVKTKEGDIFDHWVMKHLNPLLIEDIKTDFRFDTEKLKAHDPRTISSLVSAPFVSEQRFLGLMRLDSPRPHFFSQDDLRLLVTICDIGAVALENSELFQKTQDLAIHDSLTHLYTKGYFLQRLKEECKRCIRQAAVFSLLMVDIDFFKNYNDQFGHTAGDLVLQRLSVNITESLKDLNAVASRFGGEEFCIILDGVDKKKALAAADALRQRIEKERLVLRRQQTHITVSIGISAFPDDAIEEHELILKADKAMYEAKQKGRNRVIGA
jgi:diguanylate cyclase (GGDEF)-like protein